MNFAARPIVTAMFGLNSYLRNRVVIPALLISIPLYDAKGNAQQIVDAPHSAAFIRWNGQDAIADHSGQDGFQRIAYARPGKTVAYVKGEKYVCTEKQIGHIADGKIYDSKGERVRSGGLCMYTCIGETAPGVMSVWLTYWSKESTKREVSKIVGCQRN